MPTEPTAVRLAFLDGIRGLAIVFVVTIHVIAYVGISLPSSSATHNVLYALAVPPFFTVDGFLFLHRMAHDKLPSKWAYLAKSARRLLLPWLLFSFMYLGLRGVFEFLNPSIEYIALGQPLHKLLIHLYTGVAAPHLYFLPSLFLVRALALVCQALLQTRIWILLFVLGLYSMLFGQYIRTTYLDLFPAAGFDPILHSLWGVQYYLLGITLFKLWPYVERYQSIVLTAVLMIAPTFLLHNSTRILFQFTLIVGLFSLMLHMSNYGILTLLGRNTMGIYLFHSPIPIKLSQLLIGSTAEMAIIFPVVWICTLLSSLLVSIVLFKTGFGRLILGLPWATHNPAVRRTA